jgi:hypothetical protein
VSSVIHKKVLNHVKDDDSQYFETKQLIESPSGVIADGQPPKEILAK